MANEHCKECGGEVEVGEICRFCGAMAEGFEKCGTNPVNIRQYIKPSDDNSILKGTGPNLDLDLDIDCSG